jgi:DNA-binding LytR/AlgR family response regulator
MNIVLIEDEAQTALDIFKTISVIRPEYRVLSTLDSIEQAVEWFEKNPMPDLVISDIHLGDGLAFSIFKKTKITCPVIFCTAYNEYAMQAFETNGIDYILKPITDKALEKSISKVETMIKSLAPRYNIDDLERLIMDMYKRSGKYKTNFLVQFRNQLIPIQTYDISFFKVEADSCCLYTRQGQKYLIPKSLDYLESQLDPMHFHRANRQYIVSFSAVSQVEYHDDRKLLVKLKGFPAEQILVSKGKATEFIRWMEDR